MNDVTHKSSAPNPPPATPSGSGFPHFPALDGIRGIAVAVVLVFHGGFAIASGGFLGVSTFFTLSGFLITSLLLSERERSGTIALVAFWKRRFKRLLPAALLTIGAIAVFWNWLPRLQTEASFTEVSVMDRLNGDLLASTFYVSNWRAAFPPPGAGYNALFEEVVEPSPAAHFWSLSIEEQFYVFFPFIAYILLAKIGSKRWFGAVIAAGLVASIASVAVLDGFDRIYNGTDVRAAEILLGALLAVAFSTPRGREFITTNPVLRWLGVASIGVLAVLWVVTDLNSGWLLTGGLAGYGALSTIVIAAATQTSGPITAVFSWRPLRWLGEVSYGMYLYHWPIFRWIDAEAVGFDGIALFVLRMAVTTAVAWLSFHYFEQPIRRGSRPGAKVFSPALAGAAAIFAVIGFVVAYSDIGRDEGPEFDFDADEVAGPLVEESPTTTLSAAEADGGSSVDGGGGTDENTLPAPTTTSSPTTTTPPVVWELADRPPVLTIVGDSIALNMRGGLERYASATDLPEPVRSDLSFPGCGVAIGGEIEWPGERISPACRSDYSTIADASGTVDGAEVVIIVAGTVDMLPRRMAGELGFTRATEDAFFDRIEADYRDLQTSITDRGAAVLWVTLPCIDEEKAESLGIDAERVPAMNAAIERVVASADPTTQRVGVFDLFNSVCLDGEFIAELQGDPRARADGLHFSDFIADQLAVQIANEAATLGPLADA